MVDPYVPVGQTMQLFDDVPPVVPKYFPAEHAEHCVAPVLATYVPVPHVLHWLAAVKPVDAENVPAAHDPLHEEDANPVVLPYLPAAQTMH